MAACTREINIHECVLQNETPGFKFSFTDDAGNPVTPIVLRWSLMKLDGTIVNNRDDVPISAAPEVIVVLNDSGNELDLELSPEEEAQGYGWRKLVMHGIYASNDLGVDAKLESICKFKIQKS